MARLRGARLLTVLGDTDSATVCNEAARRARQVVPDANKSKSGAALLSLAEMMDACQAAGVTITVPESEIRPGVSIGMVEDPDGNWVEFVQTT